MEPLSIIAVFAGGVTAFMGYRMFLDTLRVWGFLLLGVIGAYIATLFFPSAGGAFHLSVPLVAGVLIGGVLGVIIAHPLKVVIVFLTAFLAGYLAVSTGYHMIWGGSNFLLAVGIATVLGMIAVRMEDIMLIISTSLIGAAAAIYGISSLIAAATGLIGMIVFFLIWLFGAAAQYTDARRSSQL